MKVCITSTGRDTESLVDERFGRTPYFIIFNTETDTAETVENTSSGNAQGAGIGAASLIVDHGVHHLLTGRLGPKATDALQSSGIHVTEGISGQSTVKQAYDTFKQSGPSRSPKQSIDSPPQTTPSGQPGMGMGGGGGTGCGRSGGRGRCGGGGGGGRGMGGGRRR
ncbi:NifB/NifX family molybdenum-iron cluster-binding protein [Desulfogranum japonicum]|uniref:NifB/NifX family molybdenum-iron cluster-binding protein n=1 Tax=Desulfogranum japonicum TaxID=231447 RepID=UPI0003FAB397|nr:NifB/NifX family molybdenum-iron cluster-binding protein [Desulfogranum japonicum]